MLGNPEKVIVASQNPVKVEATAGAFGRMFGQEVFRFVGMSVSSGVPDQPKSSEETLNGAESRALAARELAGQARYWVGIEGGIEDQGVGMAAFAWVVIRSNNAVGRARSGSFFLPDEIARLVRSGKELGEADDIVFGRSNSKQKEGAIGLLTGGVLDRRRLYEQAVILALAPLKNEALYRS